MIGEARIRAATWWSGLNQRERLLVGIAGTLLGLVVLVYGVVKPIQAGRAQALADIRTYETLNARIRAAGRLGNAGVTTSQQRSGTPVEIVNASAAATGVTVSTEAVDGGVRATLTDVGYDAVLAWLADLGRTSQLRATRVDLSRQGAPGRVSGTVDIAP